MARILVTADRPDGHETAILLQHQVIPADLETDQLCARLVERVGWALVDAEEMEHRTPSPALANPDDGARGRQRRTGLAQRRPPRRDVASLR